MPHLTPTPADLDVGIKSVTQVEAAKAKEWAVRNVEETRDAVRAGWKCLQGELGFFIESFVIETG